MTSREGRSGVMEAATLDTLRRVAGSPPQDSHGGCPMRALCCGLPLEGHVRPLMPLGTALVEAGHEVRVATGLDLHARVREAGRIPVAAGPSFADAFAAT